MELSIAVLVCLAIKCIPENVFIYFLIEVQFYPIWDWQQQKFKNVFCISLCICIGSVGEILG